MDGLINEDGKPAREATCFSPEVSKTMPSNPSRSRATARVARLGPKTFLTGEVHEPLQLRNYPISTIVLMEYSTIVHLGRPVVPVVDGIVQRVKRTFFFSKSVFG